jgi:ABC-2 type transport system ATP-binding protein
VAVDDVSFSVGKGEIVGLLGPNGAGKTTTLRMLSGYLPATGGTVTVAGHDVFNESLAVRRSIGYLPESAPLYGDMRVQEYLRYRGRLKGLRGKRLRTRTTDVLASCGLSDVAGRVIGRLSKGYRQRVGLADALIHEPELLLLDEPTLGLDPNQIRQIRTLIRGLAKRHTVLLCSHILPEVELICERVLILNQGRVVASDTPEKLAGLLKGNRNVTLDLRAQRDEALAALSAVPGVVGVSARENGEWTQFTCQCDKGADVREALHRAVVDHGWPLRELAAEKVDLEAVFVAMTAEDRPAGRGGGPE